jgi:hypothetical protein
VFACPSPDLNLYYDLIKCANNKDLFIQLHIVYAEAFEDFNDALDIYVNSNPIHKSIEPKKRNKFN